MAISTAVPIGAVARVVGIETIFRDLRAGNIIYLPQRIAVIGQGATLATYSLTKQRVTSAGEAGTLYGFGSPIHLAVERLLPINGDGVGTTPVTIYPLEDDVSGVAATGNITPSGTPTAPGSYRVVINNILSNPFVVVVGDTVADITAAMTTAINDVLAMPVIAVDGTTQVDLTSKWAGESANDIYVEVDGPTDIGVSYAITQPTGGLVNPDVDDALNQIGDVWETLVLNCLNVSDATTLDKYAVFGEGRWGALTKKPLMVFSGNTEPDVNTAAVIPDGRKTDRTNIQLVAPGSNNLPFVVAARELVRIANTARDNPARDYGSQDADGLVPGTDAEQWNYIQRDLAVKAGSSTIEVKGGVINLSDTVTFYHPTGEPVPAYRYVTDIIKLMNIIFNLELIFNTPEWDGAPLIPDGQPTVNRDAKTPSAAKGAVAVLIDNLALEALISDPETAKARTQAEIDSQNPKRLNIVLTVQLAGNVNIISIDLEFGFFFGTQALAA